MISDINIFVNRDLCYACGLCVDRCIMDNLRLSVPPCRQVCPLQMNCMGYIRLTSLGKDREAAEEVRKHTPFGGILARICSAPCEDACERGKLDGAVHIRALKRYLTDTHPEIAYRIPETAKETGQRTAVVGSGPAGLMAAYELRSRGHAVTVFEADVNPGGMLRNVIPSYRLPVVEVELAVTNLEEMGVSFKTNTALGGGIPFEELEAEYDALILAIGSGTPVALDIPCDDLSGVIQGLDFLKQVKAGKRPNLGRSAIIIGGGNTAFGAALTCHKMGVSEVRIICLERSKEMPAFPRVVQDALKAGIIVENGWGPNRFIQGSNGTIEMESSLCLSTFDDQGCFNPLFDPGCIRRHEADTVILAVGQQIESKGLPHHLMDSDAKHLAADLITRQSTGNKKVFVCGDCHTGPTSVVNAMASGREAAISVDRFLCGEGLLWGRDFWSNGNISEYQTDHSKAKGGPRGELKCVLAADRDLINEIEQTFSPQSAKEAAERCLSCGRPVEINKTCWYCLPCEIECPVEALEVRMPYLVR